MPEEAYLFDMDGVLADNTPFHIQAWQAYARRLGKDFSADEIKRLLGFTNEGFMRYILQREPTREEVIAAERDKESLYREIYRPYLVPPPGLIDLLQKAKRRGIACAVATSAPPENVRFIFDTLQIDPYFQTVVDASSILHPKPAPDCYLLAADRLKVAPRKCTVFEDAVAGIQAGKAAGMRVCAITTSNPADVLYQAGADLVIESFHDFSF